MRTLLKKLRGMVGIGVVWALVWAPIGLAIATAQLVLGGFGLPTAEIAVAVLVSGLQNGFAAGFLFSGGLSLAYRRRSFDEIRPATVAAIGAVAGALLPAGFLLVTLSIGGFIIGPLSIVTMLGFGAAMGAATAVGSLRVARAAPTRLPSATR